MLHPNTLEQIFSTVLVADHQGVVLDCLGCPLEITNVLESELLAPVESVIKAGLNGSRFEAALKHAGGQFRLRGVPTSGGLILTFEVPSRPLIQIGTGGSDAAEADFLTQNLRQGYWKLDANGTILAANEWLAEWLELTVEELVGQMSTIFLPNPKSLNVSPCELRFQTKSGVTKHAIVTSADWTADNGANSGTLEIITDLADENRQKTSFVQEVRNLATLSRLDGLTGLGNRMAFQEDHKRLLEEATTFGVVVADVDGFKAIIQANGQQTADRILKEVGKRIRSCIRRQDLAVRLGSDQFAILIPNATISTLEEVAYRLESYLEFQFITQDDQGISIGVSIGASHTDDRKGDLLRSAEQAMKRRKGIRKSRRQTTMR